MSAEADRVHGPLGAPSDGPAPGHPPVAFGTAGVRGRLGDGPGEVNARTVGLLADGLVLHLGATDPAADRRGVVVGRDARHGSAELAEVLVERLTRAGVPVLAFAGPVPTPLAAGAVVRLGAAAGLVVTASHNPATDNGVKVYGPDGVLLSAPADAELAARTGEVAAGEEVPEAPHRAAVHLLGDALGDHPVVAGYVADTLALVAGIDHPLPAAATTALHGVGGALLGRVLDAAGVVHHPVAEQQEPDPDFPTVPFPNPEEPGTTDMVVDLAARAGVDVALANDPDADRVAVAVRTTAAGGPSSFRLLSGDEVGALLAHHLLDGGAPPGAAADAPGRMVATTVVSSRLVPAMAAAAGVEAVVTPTGFKWLCRAALDRPGRVQVLAYEEALGYAVGPGARDKDGIAAALVVLAALGRLPRHGGEPVGAAVERLFDRLALEHGAHATANGALRLDVPAAPVVEALADPGPRTVAGGTVTRSGRPLPGALRWDLHDGTRVVLRASGTEPKLKYYCEARQRVPAGAGPGEARRAVAGRAAEVAAAVRDLAVAAAGR